jgi:hypothetical protein
VRKISGGSITTFSAGGLLVSLNDIAYDSVGNQFFVSGTNSLVKLSSTGIQSKCNDGNYRGVEVVTTIGAGRRILAANRDQSRLDLLKTDCTAGTTNAITTGLGNAFDDMYGVTFTVVSNVDQLFAVDRFRNELRRNSGGAAATNGGTNATLVSNGNGIDDPRDILVTPPNCPTPKIVIAEQSTGQLLLATDPNSGSANVQTIANGFTKPYGLAFEDSGHLLVTDETLNAVMRITGDFCSL